MRLRLSCRISERSPRYAMGIVYCRVYVSDHAQTHFPLHRNAPIRGRVVKHGGCGGGMVSRPGHCFVLWQMGSYGLARDVRETKQPYISTWMRRYCRLRTTVLGFRSSMMAIFIASCLKRVQTTKTRLPSPATVPTNITVAKKAHICTLCTYFASVGQTW